MSDGIVSEVNCTRRVSSPSTRANAIAAVVVVPLTLLQYLFGDWIRSRGEVTSYQEISTATWAVGAAGLVAALAGLAASIALADAASADFPSAAAMSRISRRLR